MRPVSITALEPDLPDSPLPEDPKREPVRSPELSHPGTLIPTWNVLAYSLASQAHR